MAIKKLTQKLVAFALNSEDCESIKKDMKDGWSIISLIKNGSHYVGIMEHNIRERNSDSIFIPAKKKIKISTQ